MNSPFFTQMLDALDQGIIIINLEGEVVFLKPLDGVGQHYRIDPSHR